MATRKHADWAKKLAWVLLLSVVPSVCYADWTDVMRKFKPRISVAEEYTSNVNLTKDNTREDFITTVSPGLTFRATETPEAKAGLDLDYNLGLVFYAHSSEKNYVSHTGTLNTWYTFGDRWTLRLWDYYIHSQDPIEYVVAVSPQPGVIYPGTQRGRFEYDRNIFQPSLTYQFGREDQLELIYRNNYYETQNPVGDDSRGDNVTPRLTYWFDIRHGIVLEYMFQAVQYDLQPDLVGHRGRARYTYRFDPRTSVFADYVYDTLNYDDPGTDFYVNNPSVGITHAFTPTLSSRLQVGYFWRNPESGKTVDGLSVDAGITQRTQRLTLDLTLQGGYSYDFFSSSALGFYQYYRGIASAAYQFGQRVSGSVVGSVEWDDYIEAGRKEWIWRVGPQVSYQVWRWLSLSLGGSFGQRQSNQDFNDYDEWRAFLRLTAAYW